MSATSVVLGPDDPRRDYDAAFDAFPPGEPSVVLTTLLNVLLMVVGFGLLIFVHELGHFLAAKWAGIRTDGFAVGMGPVMFSYRRGVGLGWGPSEPRVKALTGRGALDLSDADLERLGIGETEYSLRWLPVGGFVKMLGQDDMDPGSRSADPRSYTMCPVGKRMIVVSAGVVMNIILALVLFVVCFLVGVRFEAPVVGEVVAGLPAAEAHVVNGTALGITEPGIRPGDTVISVDGDPIVTFADLQMATAMAKPDTALTVIAERPGVETPLEFTLTPRKDPGSGLLSVGIAPASTTTLLDGRGVRGLDEALAGAGLTAQGVEPGATIVSVDGVPVEHYADLDRQATIAGGRPLTAVWMQPGQDPAEADRFVTATIGVEPVFEMFWQPALETGGPAEGDAALIGLSPLHRVTSTTPGGPADGVLMPGDLVLGVAGVSHPTLSTIRRTISTNKGEVIDLRVLRDGVEEVVSVRVRAKTGTIGIALEPAYDLNRIAAPIRDRLASAADPGSVVPTPVAAIEIPPNARIDAIDGTSTSNWTDMYRALLASTAGAAASGTGATVTLSITRPLPNEPRAEVPVALDAADVRALHALGWRVDLNERMFKDVSVVVRADGPLEAIGMGFSHTKKLMVQTYLTIDRLLRGSVGIEQLRGPVGIVHIGTIVAEKGLMYLILLLAIISVNLAVLNFLPLPIVDGGLFLFLVYEKFKGRPPSVAFQNAATLAGLFLLVGLFLVVTYNDIMRLIS